MTSLVRPLVDAAYAVCYFGTGSFLHLEDVPMRCTSSFAFESMLIPVLCFLPLFLRLIQNLRVYYDTGKRFVGVGWVRSDLRYGDF